MKVVEVKGGENLSIKEREIALEYIRFPMDKLAYRPPQDDFLEKLLFGETLLLKDIEIRYFKVVDDRGILARASLIKYEDPREYYFGFYEAIDEVEPSSMIIKHIEGEVIRDIKKDSNPRIDIKLKGPLNGSIWNGYRFKNNHFHIAPYSGEPYNKAYYVKQFMNLGYGVEESYESTLRLCPSNEEIDIIFEKAARRNKYFKDKGYEFKSLKDINYDFALEDLYIAIMNLYGDFPSFRKISKEYFMEVFSPYKYIIKKSLVTLVYKENKLQGFSIVMPDYGNNLYGRLTYKKLWEIFKSRLIVKRFIIAYIGAYPAAKGLGLGMIYELKDKLKAGREVIGSLIRKGTVTASYLPLARDGVREEREYVLLSKKI